MSEAKIFMIKHKPHDCKHKHVELDLESRQVECRDCHRVIDPFDFLLSCSVEETIALASLDGLKEELRKLNVQVNNLKKQKVFLGNKKTTP